MAWTGEGAYPTIRSFSYGETLTFGHVGKPFLALQQRTQERESGLPLHAEAGYLRPQGDGTIELVLSQPSGIVEIHTGTVAETEAGVDVDLTAEAVHLSPSAKMCARPAAGMWSRATRSRVTSGWRRWVSRSPIISGAS